MLALILANVRTPDEREGDLTAQIAANRVGRSRGCARSSRNTAASASTASCGRGAGLHRARSAAHDRADSGRRISRSKTARRRRLQRRAGHDSGAVAHRGRSAEVDFSGSRSADQRRRERELRHYAFGHALRVPLSRARRRALQRRHIPAGDGDRTARHDRERACGRRRSRAATSRHRSASPTSCSARSRGASGSHPRSESGTMNNVTLGGTDPRTGRPFAYYETIGGGMGGRPGLAGHQRRPYAHEQHA